MNGIEVDLSGRSALITGAGQGVGLEIAKALSRTGAALWLNDLDPLRAAEAAKAVASAGAVVRAVVADVTDREAVDRMAAETGPVDIVVNNAGVPPGFHRPTPFIDTSPDQWTPWMRINVDAVMHVTHAYLRPMVERRWGRILTIVSDAGRRGEIGQVAYGAAKAAAMGFMRGVAAEVGRHGVSANCIALGAIRSGMVAQFFDADPEAEKRATRAYPLGRLGRTDDAAALAVLLCSDAGSWITGQVYPVNGGYTSAL